MPNDAYNYVLNALQQSAQQQLPEYDMTQAARATAAQAAQGNQFLVSAATKGAGGTAGGAAGAAGDTAQAVPQLRGIDPQMGGLNKMFNQPPLQQNFHPAQSMQPMTQAQQQPVWGFHEPGLKAGEGVGAALQSAGNILSDPRNAWIGLSPVGVAARIPRMGAELTNVLRSERGSFNPFGWDQNPRTVSAANRLAAMDGGYVPQQGPSHFSTTTNRLSEDPVSWAKMLNQRWGNYEHAKQSGISEGMTVDEAEQAVKQLNMRPPGFEETRQLRDVVTPNYGRLPNDPRRN